MKYFIALGVIVSLSACSHDTAQSAPPAKPKVTTATSGTVGSANVPVTTRNPDGTTSTTTNTVYTP